MSINPFLVRLLREPFLHFFVLGGLIFVLYSTGDNSDKPSSDVISISAQRIDQIAAQFTSVWKRNPTEEELSTLIEEYVREEVYYRDAIKLGLDQNDTVVRQRLRQKMEFLMDNSAQFLQPTREEIEAYWAEKKATYQRGTRRAIEQIYLGQTPTEDDIARSLTLLQSDPTMNTSQLGERSLLPAQLGLSLPGSIDSVYGPGFFDQIKDFSLGAWSGPVVSAYGTHLVRILDNQPAQSPPLDKVREAVLRDWRAEKALEVRQRDYTMRREQFVIEIAPRNAQTKDTR